MLSWGWEEREDRHLHLPEVVDSTVALGSISRRLLVLRPSGAAKSIDYSKPSPAIVKAKKKAEDKALRLAENRRKAAEEQAKEEASRRALLARVESNKREAASRRRAKASTPQRVAFGGNQKSFKDVGVDLNAGGG